MIRSGMATGHWVHGRIGIHGCVSAASKAWEGLRVDVTRRLPPFRQSGNGMVQGEGAESCIRRTTTRRVPEGQKSCVEYRFAMTSDASDIVDALQGRAARAIQSALQDARINPDEVAIFNAHGHRHDGQRTRPNAQR